MCTLGLFLSGFFIKNLKKKISNARGIRLFRVVFQKYSGYPKSFRYQERMGL